MAACPRSRGDVRALARVALEVVELLARGLDIAETIVGERLQLAPTEVIARVEGLRIDALRRQAAATEDRGRQIATPKTRGTVSPASAASVGMRSMCCTGSFTRRPADCPCGSRMIHGTRMTSS